MGYQPSPQQLEFYQWVREGSGSCVLEAVAGAGKTTTLVEAVSLMQGSVFLGAFNKSMADELRDRVGDQPGKRAGTFHSAGYRALLRTADRDSAGRSRIEIDENKVRDIAERTVQGTPYEHTEGFVPAVCHLVSLAKQTGFHVRGLVDEVRPSYWRELIWRHDVADRLPEEVEEDELAAVAAEVLEESNRLGTVIDFDDMIYLPLLWNLRFYRNDWVLIDEAQDTNAVRRELAARMLRPGGRLVAVGDPHQAIYGFTGADNDSLELIRRRFRAVTMHLSFSWRCPRSVVAVAREYVHHIQSPESAAEGSVRRASYKEMVEQLAPGHAVLCRFNAPLVDLCFRLIREGKPAKIEGRAIGEGLAALVGRWKVVRLDAFENRIEAWHEREVAKIERAAKPDARKLAVQQDKYDTVKTLLERGREQGLTTVAELQSMIRSMFADTEGKSNPRRITLSSVHKSKGLEWDVVYVMGRGEIMPPKREMQPWQAEQEINLCYVAVTRSKGTLVDVAMPTEADLKRPEFKKDQEVSLGEARG